ncbi:MAG: hypothetical protein EB156_00990 [Euryarchaeota archaeon]|nr:hypothetical protein [Euryarchaeota archaeon]NDG21218.1 hypothetical protein [Euryarchaeota archaeon]
MEENVFGFWRWNAPKFRTTIQYREMSCANLRYLRLRKIWRIKPSRFLASSHLLKSKEGPLDYLSA